MPEHVHHGKRAAESPRRQPERGVRPRPCPVAARRNGQPERPAGAHQLLALNAAGSPTLGLWVGLLCAPDDIGTHSEDARRRTAAFAWPISARIAGVEAGVLTTATAASRRCRVPGTV